MRVNSFNQTYQKKQAKIGNPANPQAFKGTIILAGNKLFWPVERKLINPFEVGRITNDDWLISEAAVKKAVAFTLEARNCVVNTIVNPETKLENMYHLSPYDLTMNNLNQVKDTMFEQALKLKDGCKTRLEGLISGGDPNRSDDYRSIKLLEEIEDTYKKIAEELGMDYSVIAGRRNLSSQINVISDASTNTHYINTDCPSIKIQDTKGVKRYFEHIKISPKDTVKIEDLDITAEFRENPNSETWEKLVKSIKKNF